jgi:hypothetical protein
MSAAIVRRDDLDVLYVSAPVAVLVLDSRIGQLNVSVFVGEVVLPSPSGNRLIPVLDRSTGLAAIPILGVQEPLVLALQFLLENYTTDAIPTFRQGVSSSHVRAVHLGVVG